MEDLGVPTLTITIKKAVETVASRMKNGVAAVIVRDAGTPAGLYVLGSQEDIPTGLGTTVEAYIQRAFLGGDRRPQKVLLVVIGSEDDLVTKGCAPLEVTDFDYLSAPADAVRDGKDVRGTFVSKLDDPDAYGSERVALYNVSLDEVPLVNWERKTIQKDEVPFTFTSHKFLESTMA